MHSVREQLVDLGFSSGESDVYLLILFEGEVTAGNIAERTKIARASVHAVLHSLKSRGLIGQIMKQKRHYYYAESPDRLQLNFAFKKQEAEQKFRSVEELIPKLHPFYHKTTKPKIRYIEGLDGLRIFQKEYERMESDLIQIIGYDTFCLLDEMKDVSKEHQKELSESKRKIRSIVITDQKLAFPDLNIEFVTMPTHLNTVEGEMTVCGDRLTVFSFTSGILAVEIVSPAIAGTARAALELAWDAALRYGKLG